MRSLLTWLMVLGVLAGLSSRVLAFGHSHSHEHDHGHSDHAADHGHPPHGHPEPDHDDPDSDCPKDCPAGEHHHHHACCSSLQLALDMDACCRLAIPDSLRIGLHSLRQVPPDGPSFDLDKPPLI